MGLCLGCAKFVWPMAPELPMAELEQRLHQHEAGCWQAAQLHEPCRGGHSGRNVWGKYRSFCSQWHTGEHSVVLRLCLQATREPGTSLQLCWQGGAASDVGPAKTCPSSLALAELAMPPASLPCTPAPACGSIPWSQCLDLGR